MGIYEDQETMIANSHSQKQGHPAGVPGRDTGEASCVSCSQFLNSPMTSESPAPCPQWSLNQDRPVLLSPCIDKKKGSRCGIRCHKTNMSLWSW